MARKRKSYEKKTYTVDEVLRFFRTKRDVQIKGNKIFILSDQVWDKKKGEMVDNQRKHNDLGNGSWGRLDFLTNHNGYVIIKVGRF